MTTHLHFRRPVFSTLLAAILALGANTFEVSLTSRAGDWPQWRGPKRNGVSAETGLLKEWPKEGPKLLWKITDAGSGYAAPAIAGDRVFFLGNEDLTNEFVRALSVKDGSVLWTTQIGKVGSPDQKPNFPAARSTPTIVGDLLYALGSDGDLVCLEVATGKVRWQKNVKTSFGGQVGKWAYAESPLVDGELVVCTPGGTEATVVALNRKTGELAWKSVTPEGDEAGYASLVVVETGSTRQYVQSMQKGLAGIDAKSGKLLWRYPKMVSRYGATIPTPLADGDLVYASASGTGGLTVRLKPNGSGVGTEELYFEAKLPAAIGGAVKVGDYLYGTSAQSLLCVEFATGKIKWEERSIGAASILAADGLLFLHGENGDVALVEPSPEGYREKGRFTPPDRPKQGNPMEKAWAYPVLANGRLAIREKNSLWCYGVK